MTDTTLDIRARVLVAARGWIGTPYRHQASCKGAGADCLGLIRGVWREVMGEEPELPPAYTKDWAEAGGTEALADAARRHLTEIALADARPGDVILLRWKREAPAKHAGILSAPDHFIHAYDGAAVTESPLSDWWRRRIAYAFAFPGAGD
jgi:NlpC/P60 family putative phage cell wall peptidase